MTGELDSSVPTLAIWTWYTELPDPLATAPGSGNVLTPPNPQEVAVSATQSPAARTILGLRAARVIMMVVSLRRGDWLTAWDGFCGQQHVLQRRYGCATRRGGGKNPGGAGTSPFSPV